MHNYIQHKTFVVFSYKIYRFVNLASDLSATLLVDISLPIVRFFRIWGSLIPFSAVAVGSNATRSASRDDMIVRYWAVRIR